MCIQVEKLFYIFILPGGVNFYLLSQAISIYIAFSLYLTLYMLWGLFDYLLLEYNKEGFVQV